MSDLDANSKEDDLRQIISQLINMIEDELWNQLDLEYQNYVTDKLNEIEEKVKNI